MYVAMTSGPPGATCVDGVWSPAKIPVCEQGRHPKLENYLRGRRSVDDDTRDVRDVSSKDTSLSEAFDEEEEVLIH